MAQLGRYPNVMPTFLGSHNMNGNSERVEQRDKAKIARDQMSDVEVNKTPSGHLFPPPRKVSDSSDEMTNKVQESLGDYKTFLRIIQQEGLREKNPGQTCIGVMPIPATPTESKPLVFPSSSSTTTKTKPKDKPSHSTQERSKGNVEVEKSDQKHKPSSDSTKHKPLKLGEKRNGKKEGRDTKIVNKISLERYKNQATSGDKSSALSPGSKQKPSVSNKDDVTTNSKNQELNNDVEKIVKKEEPIEPSHQETAKDAEKTTSVQKTKLTPIFIPTKNAGSLPLLQTPQNRDMKLENILKEMTEGLNMPLTGLCQTPLLPKQDSYFPFPGNIKEKEIPEVPASTNLDVDLNISDEDSDDDKESDDDQKKRPAGPSRSRSSSESSSSSSGESSDSEPEEAEDNKIRVMPKTSMLNASPAENLTKPLTKEIFTKPLTKENFTKPINETQYSQTLSKSNLDENSNSSQTNSSKSNDTKLFEKPEENSIRTSKGSSDKVEETQDKVTSPSAGQKHTHSLNKSKSENMECLPDTKIRIKVEKGNNDSFKIKTDSKVKSENRRKSESEIKQEVKSVTEKSKIAERSGDLNLKNSSKLGMKQKHLNGLSKIKKLTETKAEKVEVNKKDEPIVQKKSKVDEKLDKTIAHKKTKRKRKEGMEGTSKLSEDKSDSLKEKIDVNSSKDKAETHSSKAKTDDVSSKDTNRTKSGNKAKKKSDRMGSLGFDSAGDEEEVIDVVGEDSPVMKKKKPDDRKVDVIEEDSPVVKRKKQDEKKNGVNGVHKNGHVDASLGIQLVHDKDKDPTSLIVKIPLSFLKRIPGKFAQELSVENSREDIELESNLEDNGKAQKDCSGKQNGENGHMEVEHEIFDDKRRHLNLNGKRSPSLDSSPHSKKRVRRDSHQDKHVPEQKKRKTFAELDAECEADIRAVEPDAHLLQAKTLKREADKLTDKEAKSRTYVEAIIRFISCGKALEDKEDGELRAGQMYSETTELLRFILKHVLGKTEDKRLLVLCLRVQSLLLHKLYRMKGKQAVRNTQILAEHFKATHKNNITSPYTTSNKHVSTPSPMSPTPSPAGSVGSIGSNGSNSSNEGNPSLNGRHASTASVTSPVSVSIPQRIHGVMAQHVSSTSKLVNSIDMWGKADTLASHYQEFFTSVDSICGALTFHSSISHIVNYVKNSLSNFHDHGKGT